MLNLETATKGALRAAARKVGIDHKLGEDDLRVALAAHFAAQPVQEDAPVAEDAPVVQEEPAAVETPVIRSVIEQYNIADLPANPGAPLVAPVVAPVVQEAPAAPRGTSKGLKIEK